MSEESGSEEKDIVIDTKYTLANIKITGASHRVLDHKGKVIVPGKE